MLRRLLAMTLSAPGILLCQNLSVTYSVDPAKDTLTISPLIYGTNGQSNDWDANITARRLGGNRMTGYNWENNASNMGMDYNQSNANDNYMTLSAGITDDSANVPGITLRTFHDTSLAMGCYSLITLPAAGYVSRDKNGPVSVAESAPSPRWRRVVNVKGSAFSTHPDTSDGFVYDDEEVNFLVSTFGSAATSTGVKGYAVDNEPALWPSTHPRLHPQQTTGWEVIAKNVAVARAVKSVDPAAEVFGGVFYGFNELYDMQGAPDTAGLMLGGRYVNGFLAKLHDSSDAAGKRLLDVLDLHWYPDLYVPITGDASDSVTARVRMAAPRSLWDSTYREDGWIGQWFSPVALLPNTLTGIKNWYPGTKLAISEFTYGAPQHISGGIALSDVLGIFGRYGVYFATHWGAVTDYLTSAYKMYRNYDGNRSTFGDLSVHAATADTNSSVYAALHKDRPGILDVVLMNKNFHRPIDARIMIAGSSAYHSAKVYFFDSDSATIRRGPDVAVQGDSLHFQLQPLSVYHLVLSSVPLSAPLPGGPPRAFALDQNYPNPFNPSTTIDYHLAEGGWVTLKVFDILGREVSTLVHGSLPAGDFAAVWSGEAHASGVYFYTLQVTAPGGKTTFRAGKSMVLVK